MALILIARLAPGDFMSNWHKVDLSISSSQVIPMNLTSTDNQWGLQVTYAYRQGHDGYICQRVEEPLSTLQAIEIAQNTTYAIGQSNKGFIYRSRYDQCPPKPPIYVGDIVVGVLGTMILIGIIFISVKAGTELCRRAYTFSDNEALPTVYPTYNRWYSLDNYDDTRSLPILDNEIFINDHPG